MTHEEAIKATVKELSPEIVYLYRRTQLVGCVMRMENKFGYSYCHKSDRHKLTKKLAREIAFGRLLKCELAKDAKDNYVKYRNGRPQGHHRDGYWNYDKVPYDVMRAISEMKAAG